MVDQSAKILYLIDELHPAGTEKQLLLLAENLCRDRFDPVIGVLQSTPYQSQLRLKTPIVNFDRRGPIVVKNLGVLCRLRAFLRKERVALVQTQLVDAAILGTLAVRLSKPRPILVATRRNAYHLKQIEPLGFHLNRLAACWADMTVANSHCARDLCARIERIPAGRIELIENGIDLQEYGRLSTLEAKRRIGLYDVFPLIGVVANWRPVKGLAYFLESAALLKHEFPSAHFVLAGEGSQGAELQRRAKALGIAEQVHFLEGLIDVADAIAAFDVAVQCSLSESFSNVLIEYMASARPIVATRVGDAERVIEHGIDGILVKPADPPGLCAAIASLVRNPEAACKIGNLARAKAEHYWASSRMASAYQDLYQRLIEKRECAILKR